MLLLKSPQKQAPQTVSGDHINNDDDWAIAPPQGNFLERKSIWTNRTSRLASQIIFILKYCHMEYIYGSQNMIGSLR